MNLARMKQEIRNLANDQDVLAATLGNAAARNGGYGREGLFRILPYLACSVQILPNAYT